LDTTEISLLTREAIAELLAGRAARNPASHANGRRHSVRWPFPGTVEMWLPDGAGVEHHTLGTCLNLSTEGVGLLADDPISAGTQFALAVHQPEGSFHGRGIARHCTEVDGVHYIGVQFLFE